MKTKTPTNLPFEGNDEAEDQLWKALSDVPQSEPSPHLRRRFYDKLHAAGSGHWTTRMSRWLGMNSSGGWATVAACLMLGFGVAQVFERTASGSPRLEALEENLAHLQRELILDRLQDTSVSTRLRGVVDASQVAPGDPVVTQALLDRAAQDSSSSVRSAAIDALGPRLETANVGSEVMQLMESAESPIVQLALVDMVLRHGDSGQIRQLQELADEGGLHPDLVRHVNKALRSQSI